MLILGREGNAKVNCNIQCLKSPCFALVLPCFPLPNMTTLCDTNMLGIYKLRPYFGFGFELALGSVR